MPKNKLRMLLAVLAGIAIFIAIVLVMHIPLRIATGNRAQLAIQMLDAMRVPMLAIEDSEVSKSGSDKMKAFNRAEGKLRKLVVQYLDMASYNPELYTRVELFSSTVEDWLAEEEKLREDKKSLGDGANDTQAYRQLEQQYETAVEYFLQSLKVLALGEQPVHQDIKQGRHASYALQVLTALLILYLLALIIIFQRISRRELLASFH